MLGQSEIDSEIIKAETLVFRYKSDETIVVAVSNPTEIYFRTLQSRK